MIHVMHSSVSHFNIVADQCTSEVETHLDSRRIYKEWPKTDIFASFVAVSETSMTFFSHSV